MTPFVRGLAVAVLGRSFAGASSAAVVRDVITPLNYSTYILICQGCVLGVGEPQECLGCQVRLDGGSICASTMSLLLCYTQDMKGPVRSKVDER